MGAPRQAGMWHATTGAVALDILPRRANRLAPRPDGHPRGAASCHRCRCRTHVGRRPQQASCRLAARGNRPEALSILPMGHKPGRSGERRFVTVQPQLFRGGELAISEEHAIFGKVASTGSTKHDVPRTPDDGRRGYSYAVRLSLLHLSTRYTSASCDIWACLSGCFLSDPRYGAVGRKRRKHRRDACSIR